MHQPHPLKTFIIYASADRDLREEFERHLRPLVDDGMLNLWSDREILPGALWDKAIETQLEAADLFLMLVSIDFYNSEYIRKKEFKTAIERLEKGHSMAMPVIIRHCIWNRYGRRIAGRRRAAVQRQTRRRARRRGCRAVLRS
ncbi:MAG: toll/interleukin-1 receptor domain-containing protein, partial [Saprospiraceae bacterium]